MDVLIRDFPKELLVKVDKMAKKEGRSRPKQIIVIVQRVIDMKVKKNGDKHD